MIDSTDDRLRLLIERIERLEEEKKGIADDVKDVYAEAKAVGYDVKMMRQVIKLRKLREDERAACIDWAFNTLAKWIGCTVDELTTEG